MRDKRLLERLLEAPERDELRAHRQPEQRLRASVIGHLSKLLNTRRGNAAIDPEYGLPDLSKWAGGTLAAAESAQAEALVAEVLRRYEPRLQNPAVRLLGAASDQLALRLELSGTIDHAGSRMPLRLTGEIQPDGRFELQP